MSTVSKSVAIEADANQVYAALTGPAAYRAWWCTNSAVADWVGGQSVMHFKKDGEPVSMTFRVDELAPNERVRWTCTANDAPPWVGTTLSWSIEPSGNGAEVTFEHGGWGIEPPQMVGDTWDHFLGSLKSFVERGEGQPW